MSTTQPSNANAIEIYRDMKFTYDGGLAGDVNCECPCDTSKCRNEDKLFLYGVRPSPVKELYNYFQKGMHEVTTDGSSFGDDEWSDATGDAMVNINRETKVYDDREFIKWQGLMNSYTSACVICRKIKEIVDDASIADTLTGLKDTYNSKRSENSQTLDDLIHKLTTQQARFNANTEEIQQLQKKIRLAHELLNAQADKLKTFGQSFTSLQVQYQKRHKDRVSFGLPYFKPIYTMSSRQYFVLMVVLNVVLIVVMVMFGLYTRKTRQDNA